MTEIDNLIKMCDKPTIEDCLNALKQLDRTEKDVLIRTFEFNSTRFREPLKFAMNYMLK